MKQSSGMYRRHLSIESKKGVGTNVSVTYHTDHIDCMPLGDITETMVTLITSHDEIDFWFAYKVDGEGFQLDNPGNKGDTGRYTIVRARGENVYTGVYSGKSRRSRQKDR